MLIYVKTLLYSYANLESITNHIDDVIMRKALASFGDFSPAEEQAEKLYLLQRQKAILKHVKKTLDSIFEQYSAEDMKYFEYKYFKRKDKKYFEDFDASSRAYFRKQIKLINSLKHKLKANGIDEVWFNQMVLPIDFMNELYHRIKIVEENSEKERIKKINRKKTVYKENVNIA